MSRRRKSHEGSRRDDDGRAAGIVTDRDICIAVATRGRSADRLRDKIEAAFKRRAEIDVRPKAATAKRKTIDVRSASVTQ